MRHLVGGLFGWGTAGSHLLPADLNTGDDGFEFNHDGSESTDFDYLCRECLRCWSTGRGKIIAMQHYLISYNHVTFPLSSRLPPPCPFGCLMQPGAAVQRL